MFATTFLLIFITMLLNSNSIHPLTQKLLDWYLINKRDLPWRDDPIAYHVWVAEIVFQQTRIEQGMGYYNRLIEHFPSVYKLAEAEEKEVLQLWEGLGYYSRARNLHASAKIIVEKYSGSFPSDYDSILSLKGIGPYTAAAISSIAFGIAKPAIDGNVLRVASRLFCIEEPINVQKTYKIIEKHLAGLIDQNMPGNFNQGMMELGSMICKPQNPDCFNCPISEHCMAYSLGIQNELPVKKKKNAATIVHYHFYLFHNIDEIVIEKRGNGIWKNMYQFPLLESKETLSEPDDMNFIEELYIEADYSLLESDIYKHILSHRIIFAKFIYVKLDELNFFEPHIIIKKSDLLNYPMPQILRKFLSSEEAKRNLLI